MPVEQEFSASPGRHWGDAREERRLKPDTLAQGLADFAELVAEPHHYLDTAGVAARGRARSQVGVVSALLITAIASVFVVGGTIALFLTPSSHTVKSLEVRPSRPTPTACQPTPASDPSLPKGTPPPHLAAAVPAKVWATLTPCQRSRYRNVVVLPPVPKR